MTSISKQSPQHLASKHLKSKRLTFVFVAKLTIFGIAIGGTGFLFGQSTKAARPKEQDASPARQPSSLEQLLALNDESLERVDPLEADLAVARTVPGCESLNVANYKRIVDGWAEHVRAETERHLYRFTQNPADYKNSLPYFKSLVLATVIGQDFKITYHIDSIAFDDPADLFVYGVIDNRRGTCVSLPVLYMAIGHRLGYPIKAVSLPKHVFCRWDNPITKERLNIEAANAGGLSDHSDEYYRSWPVKLDQRDVETGGTLKTLTMRQFIGVKLASRGDYYWKKDQYPPAQVSYALAHQFYPECRFIYEILVSQLIEESDRYPWSIIARRSTPPNKLIPSPGSKTERKGAS